MRKEPDRNLFIYVCFYQLPFTDIYHRCKKTLLVVLLTAAGKYDIRVELTLNHRMHELLYIQQPYCFYMVVENNLLLLRSLTLFFAALINACYSVHFNR